MGGGEQLVIDFWATFSLASQFWALFSMTSYHKAVWVMSTTAVPVAIFITAFFWIILYSSDSNSYWYCLTFQ